MVSRLERRKPNGGVQNEYEYVHTTACILTSETALSHLAPLLIPLMFSALGQAIKSVALKMKRNTAAGNDKMPSVQVQIFIKFQILS